MKIGVQLYSLFACSPAKPGDSSWTPSPDAAPIFRTDEHGVITVRTDGQSLWVEPYVHRPAESFASLSHGLVETRTPSAALPR
jgi:hypothetical protein